MIVEYFVAFVALALGLISLIQNILSGKNKFWDKHGIPTLKMENVLIRLTKGMGFLETDAELYKQMENLKYGGVHEPGHNIVVVKDLEVLKQIFVKDFDHFVNRRVIVAKEKFWNSMMFNKVDKDWKDLRSVMTPTFTTGKIRRMFPLLEDSAKKCVDYVTKSLEEKGKVNIEDALGRYCMDGTCSIAFGIDSEIFKNENSIVAAKANKINLQFNPLVNFKVFLSLMMPEWARVYPSVMDADATAFLSKLIYQTVEHREKSGEKRNDFVQIMLDAKNGKLKNDEEDNEQHETKETTSNGKNLITNDIIVANCITFILGGFDTTKSAVIFAAYSLATNPDVQDKLRNELQTAVDENDGEFSYDMANTHEYLDMVANETLRMYPPGTRLERLCTKDYAIPNTKAFIPKGSLVWMPAYSIHHDPEHFPNPGQFDPERFSSEGKAKRHPYAFMPFGHGPRNCIANRFALVQTKALIAHMVLNFDIETTAETIIPVQLSTTGGLRPSHPLHLKLTPRN